MTVASIYSASFNIKDSKAGLRMFLHQVLLLTATAKWLGDYIFSWCG